MTDYPRFRPVTRGPEDAWRDHHGAPVVGLVFKIADAWMRRPTRAEPRGVGYVLTERRALVQPVAGLVRARAVVLGALMLGIVAWAIMSTGAAEMTAIHKPAVTAHIAH